MKIIEKICKNHENRLENPIPTICFFGDSLTQGAFRTHTDYEAVYHNRIKKKLNFIFPDAVVNIINSGIGGTTAEFGVGRLERDVISKNPDLCVVCFGLNDAGGREEGLDTYKNSLDTIFKKLNQTGMEVIFMTPNMMNTAITDIIPEQHAEYAVYTMDIQNNGIMDKYMECAIAVAKENNVPVCDCYARWKKLAECGVDTNRLLANGINHPLRQMHELFADALLETMFD